MGVVSAVLKYVGVDAFASAWNATKGAEWLAVVVYIALITYFILHTLKAKKEE